MMAPAERMVCCPASGRRCGRACLRHDPHAVCVGEGAVQRVQRHGAAAAAKADHAQLAHLHGGGVCMCVWSVR